ncbi:unnamed protein product, partial [Polarella glacialis]
ASLAALSSPAAVSPAELPEPTTGDSSDTFAAALEKIRTFERSQMAARPARHQPAGRQVQQEEDPAVSQPEATPKLGEGSGSTRIAAVATSSSEPVAVAQRHSVKSMVQDRYLALLLQGCHPNEAAARAILEVSGQQAAGPVTSPRTSEKSASPRSTGTLRSCASEAQDSKSHGGQKKKVVHVAA